MMSHNSNHLYCSPKTLGCSVCITITEIQSIFFGHWERGLSFLEVTGIGPKLQEILEVSRIV